MHISCNYAEHRILSTRVMSSCTYMYVCTFCYIHLVIHLHVYVHVSMCVPVRAVARSFSTLKCVCA